MTVIAMDCAPPGVRGELSRWFLEVKPGVFVGSVNTKIRQLLWERICTQSSNVGAVLIYDMNNEQGFAMEVYGCPKRTILDLDGILLVKVSSSDDRSPNGESHLDI